MKKKYRSIETKLIKAGEPDPLIAGAVSMPVFQSSTYAYEGQGSYHDLKYIRLNNTPNHAAVHEKLAALENAEAALVSASGMAAISTTLLALLSPGDRLLAQNCLYGGTLDLLVKDFARMGILCDFIDGHNPSSWEEALQPNAKALYVETITNPLMDVIDLKKAAEFAKEHGLISIIDNTFASPVNFRPAEWGFDISIHSCTKYLNGHSDIVAGAVIGPGKMVEKITRLQNHLGGSLDPHACFLLHRGMKTLAVRMKHQNESAMKIASYLEGHPAVERVNYPGLETHPGHENAKKYLDGYSGMISFELKGDAETADRFIENAAIPIQAPSLGGVESLITRPVTTSHSGLSPEELERFGISERLVRFSVGLEAADDIIEDFDRAFDACRE